MLSRLTRLHYKWLVAIVFMFGLFMDIIELRASLRERPECARPMQRHVGTVKETAVASAPASAIAD